MMTLLCPPHLICTVYIYIYTPSRERSNACSCSLPVLWLLIPVPPQWTGTVSCVLVFLRGPGFSYRRLLFVQLCEGKSDLPRDSVWNIWLREVYSVFLLHSNLQPQGHRRLCCGIPLIIIFLGGRKGRRNTPHPVAHKA